jgi:hypothetical protein
LQRMPVPENRMAMFLVIVFTAPCGVGDPLTGFTPSTKEPSG